MKQMKQLVIICMLALFSANSYSQTTSGDSSVGFNLGYGFDSENVTLGFDYRYNFTDAVRFAPSLSYFVKNNGLSAWAIDMNVHYAVKITEMFGFYPLAGLDLSFWRHKWDGVDAYNNRYDYTDTRTRFGVNLGLGGELYASDELTIGLEIKYNIIKDFDQAILALRIGYNF